MKLSITELKRMAETVVKEALHTEPIGLELTSIGWNPNERLHAVFEGRFSGTFCTHLVQVELTQVDDERLYGQLIKPSSLAGIGFRLVFRKLSAWTYQRMYR